MPCKRSPEQVKGEVVPARPAAPLAGAGQAGSGEPTFPGGGAWAARPSWRRQVPRWRRLRKWPGRNKDGLASKATIRLEVALAQAKASRPAGARVKSVPRPCGGAPRTGQQVLLGRPSVPLVRGHANSQTKQPRPSFVSEVGLFHMIIHDVLDSEAERADTWSGINAGSSQSIVRPAFWRYFSVSGP